MTDAHEHLKSYASQQDKDIELADLALAVVAPDHDGVSIDRYVQHFRRIESKVAKRYDALISGGAEDDVYVRLASLKHVLSDTYDYRSDCYWRSDGHDLKYEVLENFDIMRVVDRARGGDAALCVLYMNGARKQGWLIEGLDFPGNFLCRLEMDGERLIFDPSQKCKILDAHDLRDIVKKTLGEHAELSTDYFNGLCARETIIHMCNRIKLRYIETGDYKAALDMVERMRAIAPNEYRLLLDAGVMYARLHNNEAAISCLNDYIERAPNFYDRQEATLLLNELLGSNTTQ